MFMVCAEGIELSIPCGVCGIPFCQVSAHASTNDSIQTNTGTLIDP